MSSPWHSSGRCSSVLTLIGLLVVPVTSATAQTCFHMGSVGSIILPEGGDIFLAFNDNNGTYFDNSGSFQVTVQLKRGGQVIQGPTVVNVCGRVAPCLSDFCGGTGSLAGIHAPGWLAQAGDELSWTASGAIDRFAGQASTGPAGSGAEDADSNFLCATFGNAWGLVGAVNGWPQGAHTPPGGGAMPCADPCPPVVSQIACGDVAQQDCNGNTLWTSEFSGACSPAAPLPAASEWGLTILVLGFLSAGTLAIRQSRRQRDRCSI